jgi:hypothetical protein
MENEEAQAAGTRPNTPVGHVTRDVSVTSCESTSGADPRTAPTQAHAWYMVIVGRTDMGPGGEGWGPAFLFVSLFKNLHPDPASHAAGRVGGGRRPAAHAASRAGIGARQPLWVTHTHQAGRRRWRGAARGD